VADFGHLGFVENSSWRRPPLSTPELMSLLGGWKGPRVGFMDRFETGRAQQGGSGRHDHGDVQPLEKLRAMPASSLSCSSSPSRLKKDGSQDKEDAGDENGMAWPCWRSHERSGHHPCEQIRRGDLFPYSETPRGRGVFCSINVNHFNAIQSSSCDLWKICGNGAPESACFPLHQDALQGFTFPAWCAVLSRADSAPS